MNRPVIVILAAVISLVSLGCDDGGGGGGGTDDSTGTNSGTDTGDGTQYETDLSVPLVVTRYGPIKGRLDEGVAAFLGIPYAAPPVGDLRWAPPQEPERWDTPLETTSFRHMCVQPRGQSYDYLQGRVPLYSDDCPEECEGDGCCVGGEDCLYLNVWTGAEDPSERLPVLVWIHGGAFLTGTAANPWTDGARMAREHHMVVVGVDYRLNVFGFLAHPSLTDEQGGHSGNYGIMDQIAALRWVKENIAEFGGDPDKVTIVGESAGGWSVCILLTSPLAEGLFDRAIIESIGCDDVYSIRRLDETTPRTQASSAHYQGIMAAAALGCSSAPDQVACLRQKSALEIMRTLKPKFNSFLYDYVYKPIVDGYVIPDATLEMLRQHRINATHVISGINGHEDGYWRWANIFPMFGIQGFTLSAADETEGVVDKYHEMFRGWFGDAYYDDALAMWGDPATGSDAVVFFENMITDVMFNCPTRRQLRLMAQAGAQTYRYVFTRVPPGTFAQRERLGAVHASEIKYVFGNFDLVERYYQPLNGDDETLATEMVRTWASFAAGEDPSFRGISWDSDPDAVMVLDVDGTMGGDWNPGACDLVDEVRDSTYCTGAPDEMPWVCLF